MEYKVVVRFRDGSTLKSKKTTNYEDALSWALGYEDDTRCDVFIRYCFTKEFNYEEADDLVKVILGGTVTDDPCWTELE